MGILNDIVYPKPGLMHLFVLCRVCWSLANNTSFSLLFDVFKVRAQMFFSKCSNGENSILIYMITN